MFAINHAATGLIIKKIYPGVSLGPILVSVQLIEIIWVILNLVGVEKTKTENSVTSVSDVHLEYMPFSHSVVSTLVLAAVTWGLAWYFMDAKMGAALALGICSHLVLDLVSHSRDIVVAPFLKSGKFGLGLYEKPAVAFVFETAYGVLCWWIYGGSIVLLGIIVFFNLANVSFFLKAVPGPERFLAGKPKWITSIVALQIIVTAVLVYLFS
ncbi:MAG: hypothetical protein PHY31_08205 [Smithellaceae bacterium]|nr:hypothetical protein [Smithellaceae bacterium]